MIFYDVWSNSVALNTVINIYFGYWKFVIATSLQSF